MPVTERVPDAPGMQEDDVRPTRDDPFADPGHRCGGGLPGVDRVEDDAGTRPEQRDCLRRRAGGDPVALARELVGESGLGGDLRHLPREVRALARRAGQQARRIGRDSRRGGANLRGGLVRTHPHELHPPVQNRTAEDQSAKGAPRRRGREDPDRPIPAGLLPHLHGRLHVPERTPRGRSPQRHSQRPASARCDSPGFLRHRSFTAGLVRHRNDARSQQTVQTRVAPILVLRLPVYHQRAPQAEAGCRSRGDATVVRVRPPGGDEIGHPLQPGRIQFVFELPHLVPAEAETGPCVRLDGNAQAGPQGFRQDGGRKKRRRNGGQPGASDRRQAAQERV